MKSSNGNKEYEKTIYKNRHRGQLEIQVKAYYESWHAISLGYHFNTSPSLSIESLQNQFTDKANIVMKKIPMTSFKKGEKVTKEFT